MTLADLIDQMVGGGVFDYVLPFMLVFVLIYAILQKTELLGKKKSIDALVAFVAGLFIMYFGRIYEIGKFLTFFTGKSSLVIVILIFFLMIAIFLFKALEVNNLIPEGKKSETIIIVLLVTLFLIYLMLRSSPGTWQILFGEGASLGSGVIMAVVVIVLLALFIMWATGG